MPFLKLWNLLNFIVSSALGDPKVKSSPDNKIRLFFSLEEIYLSKRKEIWISKSGKSEEAGNYPPLPIALSTITKPKKPQSQFILKLTSLKPWAFHSKKELSKASLNLTFPYALNENAKGSFFEKDFQNRFFFPYSFLGE